MSRRIVRRPLVVEDRLPEDLNPVLRRVYLGRGITEAEDLDLSFAGLASVDLLGNLQPALEQLHRAMVREDPIVIIGDYDADGATSTALALRGLQAMGARRVDFLVPNRFHEGYGLTPALVERAAGLGARLILTVDNGVGSVAAVDRARELEIAVVVTDHHLPGARLPDAVIVNPNLPGDPFPSKHLAGVGVAFYLLAGLRRHLRQAGWFGSHGLAEPNLAEFLDLVALGTVADVVSLDRNNRILVEQGLRRIRRGGASPGIGALLAVAGRNLETVTSVDLGFAVAPRLNAAGRLADMSLGIRCLLSQDRAVVETLAGRLDELNRERRQIEAEMREGAEVLVEALGLSGDNLPEALCLFDPSWHQGVIGILASRLAGRHQRPVIAFAPGAEGELKGSARSVPGIHLRDALDAVARRDPGLIQRFGGHAMAAGLCISSAQLDRFSERFAAEVNRRLEGMEPPGVLPSDGELGAEDWRLETAWMLRHAGPWGQGFPEPLFDGAFTVVDRRIVGERHLKLRVRPPGTELVLDAIVFDPALKGVDPQCLGERMHLGYHLDINQYGGSTRLQLIVEHLERQGAPCAA
jgi:single-stranded-DNA-specific exonuclease